MTIVRKKKLAMMGALTCIAVVTCNLLIDMHWGWIFLSAALITLFPVLMVKNETGKSLFICLCTIFVICAAAEWYFMAQEEPGKTFEGAYNNVLTPDTVLGYRPEAKETRVQARCFSNGTLLYDVTYSTNATGWRVTPVHPEAQNAVVFFGCSFTFGEGLNDEDSYPYITAQLLGPQYQVFNFGFHGYGPHQFLAFLESGVLNDIAKKYQNVQVFMLNIPQHEQRSGGFSFWDLYGPRYVNENGFALRKGHFHALPNTEKTDGNHVSTRLLRKLWKSKLHETVRGFKLNRETEQLLLLQCAIFRSGKQYIEQSYANASFTLMAFPGIDTNYRDMLKKNGIPILDVEHFFKDNYTEKKYKIPVDGHPSALANRELSEGIAKYIQTTCKSMPSPAS